MNNSKLISWLLVLAMVMSMVVLPVAATEGGSEGNETTETTVTEEPAAPAECPLHPGAEWTEVTAAQWAAGAALTTGHYKLTEDVALTAALTVAADQTVCIDLAGFDLTQTTEFATSPTEAHRVLEVTGGALTVLDSTAAEVEGVYTSGVISGGWANARAGADLKAFGGNVYLVEGATFNLYSGTISGGKVNRHGIGNDATYGGNIYADSATVNICGGLIQNGAAVSNYGNTNTNSDREASVYGGNIAVLNGTTLNISGGTITGGAAENNFTCKLSQGTFKAGGGNIHIASGSIVNISGGVISDGVASASNQGITVGEATVLTSYVYGGNITLMGSESQLNITGGTVKNGTATATAAPYGEGTLGKAVASARGGNIYIASGTLTVSGGKVQGGSTAASATGTATDESRYGGNIYNYDTLNITGGTVSGGDAKEGGTVFVSGTVNMSGGKLVGGTAVSGGGIFLNDDRTMTVTGGTIQGGVANSGGAIYTKGTLNISGGEITGGTASATNKTADEYFKLDNKISTGGNLHISEGTVTVSGDAKITDGCAYYRGGNVYNSGGVLILKDNAVVEGGYNYFAALSNASGAIDIEATEELPAVKGNVSAEWGGNIYNNATVKMYDNAVIRNGVAARGGNYASATKNGKLYMYGGAIYGGDARREASDDLKLYNHANVLLEVYAGYIEHIYDHGDLNTVSIYGGAMTSNKALAAACEKVHTTAFGNGFIFWHADGACDTCSHTFAAAGADTACATCEAVHQTSGGVHSYEDGVCTVCGYAAAAHGSYSCGCENPEWVAWDGVTIADGGHYYLTDDLQLTAQVLINIDNAKVCIDLNGFTLTTAPGERGFNLPKNTYCTLNLMNGTVRGGGVPTTASGGLVYVGYDAHLNAYDVVFTGGITDEVAGGNIYCNGKAFLVNCQILNGKILNTGEKNGADGGNIAVFGATAQVHLQGCTVANGDVTTVNNAYGGNIYSTTNSTLILDDTTVTGGNANVGGNIYLMNGAEGGYAYIYGDTQIKDSVSETGFYVQGTDTLITNLYVFGGYIEELKDNRDRNEILIFNGTFGFDPTTANYDGSSMVAGCACVSYDEATGIYTVSHDTNTLCDGCEAYSLLAPVTYTHVGGHTYGDGETVCSVCGNVVAKIGETGYTELSAALEAATATDVVVLQKSQSIAALDLYTTLDLNGFTLKVNGMLDASNADGNVIDSNGAGAVTAGEVRFYETNDHLAVLIDGSYKYETVEAKQKIEEVDATTKSMKFIIADEAEDTLLDDILVDGTEFTVRITVTWNSGANVHHFNYGADLVKAYGLDAEGNSVWGEKMFTCTIDGLDEIGEHTITAEIVSCGVVVAATPAV